MIRYIIYNNARVIFRFFILSTSAHIRFETSFRLSRAPRGSRFLRKPAPICERLTNLHSLHLQKRTKDRILYAVAPDGEIAVP